MRCRFCETGRQNKWVIIVSVKVSRSKWLGCAQITGINPTGEPHCRFCGLEIAQQDRQKFMLQIGQ